MTRYEAIYEELTERVEAGELSLEDAEIINEAAAEKYLTEGNAFNRVVKDKVDEVKKIENRINGYKKMKRNAKHEVFTLLIW